MARSSVHLGEVQDVQRVGILDVRIVNMDRNDGNLLVKKRAERGDERALSKSRTTAVEASFHVR